MILYPMKGDETVVMFDPFRKVSAANPIRAHLMAGMRTECGRVVEWGEVRIPWRLVAGTTLVRVCEACRKGAAKRDH